MKNLKEADITFKARGSEFEFIKLVCVEEKESCSMKVQEVVFGDFKMADIPKSAFSDLIGKLEKCKMPFPGYSDGKSGNQYQLDIQAGENAMNFKWFGDSVGDQWKDIIAFTEDIKALKNKFI